jgi:DNA-binding response OmpR family regulator
MDQPRGVLIVDPSQETQEVLQTALERRGLRTWVASRPRQGLSLAREHHPDVIVLDLELDGADPEEFSGVSADAADTSGQLVMLGTLRRPARSESTGQYLAKPYHYAALIRKIEELLGR